MHKLKGLSEVVEFLGKNDNFVVVGDYDADGITGSSIIGMALKRLSKDFRILQSRAVNYEKLEIAKGLGDNYVFVDFGSGIVSLLEKTFPRLNFAVIDHHEPEKVGEFPHFNVHLSGYNGATDLSSSGSAYFVARELGDNKDLCTIAVVGAVGDMQDSKGKLEGLNLEVLKDGKENDLIEIRKDIRIFGRHSRPLTQFLSYCTEPFFPGLSANENASREFLKDLGIKLTDGAGGDKWRYYCDLSGDEKKRLVSALYVYGKDKEIPEFVLKTLVGEVYELKKEKDRTELKDTREFSTLLNACGRHDRAELGLAVCMGDRGKLSRRPEGSC